MYLDPGFGGMLIQLIVVIAAVGGGIVFSLRKKIRNFFSKKRDNDTVAPTISKTVNEDAVDVLDS